MPGCCLSADGCSPRVMAEFMTRMSTEEAPCRPNGITFQFKLAKLGAEAGLLPVGFTNANLMVTLGEIELGKPLCPPRLVEESVNVGRGSTRGSVMALSPR